MTKLIQSISRRKQPWSKDESLFVRNYYFYIPIKEIAAILERSETAIKYEFYHRSLFTIY